VQRLNVKGQAAKVPAENVICSATVRPVKLYKLVATWKAVLVTPEEGFCTFVTTIVIIPVKMLVAVGARVAVREVLPELGVRVLMLLYLN
jgi:hypothetical protein